MSSSSGRQSAKDTVGTLLDAGRERLEAPREAFLLLDSLLGRGEALLRAFPERTVDPATARAYRSLVDRRAAGEPVAYLVGYREFWGRDFAVDPRVLIPRPETEHLVEAVLARLRAHAAGSLRLLDVGTGSGILAVTLAAELPRASVIAVDIETGALEVTRRNARRHGVADRVHCVRCDLTSALELDEFDAVVSNPPYVAADSTEVADDVRAHEPHRALFAADRGRAALDQLLDAASALRPDALLALEIGHDQGDWLRQRLAASDTLRLVDLVRDYGGWERTAVLRRSQRVLSY